MTANKSRPPWLRYVSDHNETLLCLDIFRSKANLNLLLGMHRELAAELDGLSCPRLTFHPLSTGHRWRC